MLSYLNVLYKTGKKYPIPSKHRRVPLRMKQVSREPTFIHTTVLFGIKNIFYNNIFDLIKQAFIKLNLKRFFNNVF